MHKPNILVFASGTPTEGGSSFKNLVEASLRGALKANVVGVVCNHLHGGVRQKANALGIPFHYFPGPWTGKKYQKFVKKSRADFVVLAGWLKLAKGLDPKRTINIHPGPLPEFGGFKMYGHHVHEAVIKTAQQKMDPEKNPQQEKLTHTEVCIHFVNKPREGKMDYDRGHIIFRWPVPIHDSDTAGTLATRVLAVEHEWLPIVANWLVKGLITWSGRDKDLPQFWTERYAYHKRRELPDVIKRPVADLSTLTTA